MGCFAGLIAFRNILKSSESSMIFRIKKCDPLVIIPKTELGVNYAAGVYYFIV